MNDFPQQRANLVADQAIKHSPSLLRIDLLQIEFTRLLKRFVYGLRRDLVEVHPFNVGVFTGDRMRYVPSNGLALPVRVCCQQEAIALLQLGFKVSDLFPLLTSPLFLITVRPLWMSG